VPLAWLVTAPFFVYTLLFLLVPAGYVTVGAFKGTHGGVTLDHIRHIFDQPYRRDFENSIVISLKTAVIGAALGLLIAYAAVREGTPRWVRSVYTTFSGVAANFAGVPLAFAFIATLGTIGFVTQFMTNQLHYNPYDHGFQLFGKTGVVVVYLYFQIPLMILVIMPAIDGLKREWREACASLGGSSLHFWRHVGVPILTPSLLSAIVLLFGNSFSAYATAYGLTGGGVGLVPIDIGYYLSGNVLSDPALGQALAFGMFVVLAVMMMIYVPLQRISSRWQR
jgi:putative spermidine/putrescine transport system permease protein